MNGGKQFRSIAFKHESIADWVCELQASTRERRPDLCYVHADWSKCVDLFVVGFEEIVDLNASNMWNASVQNQRDWGDYLHKLLNGFISGRAEGHRSSPSMVTTGSMGTGVTGVGREGVQKVGSEGVGGVQKVQPLPPHEQLVVASGDE